jgi:hypothetical protein
VKVNEYGFSKLLRDLRGLAGLIRVNFIRVNSRIARQCFSKHGPFFSWGAKAGPLAVWFIVLLLYAVSGLISPGMFQFGQILNIFQVAAFLGVVATGQTIALTSLPKEWTWLPNWSSTGLSGNWPTTGRWLL